MPYTPLPFVDLRGKTPMDLLRAYPDRARDLIKANRRIWGRVSDIASIPVLPIADFLSHRWLKKQFNPYLHEIETFADTLGTRGIYAFNVAFEWACTTGIFSTGESVTLLRTLDWPFPALGKYTVIALQQGKAGTFYNITWPGMAGVFTAMAPGRFSAAINQAPLRKSNLTFIGDWIKARFAVRKQRALPPSHLLRQVFEHAADYEEAKKALAETPIAAPAIFTLGGIRPGEGCIIERLEDCAGIIELGVSEQVTVTNHFNSALNAVGHGWWPRAIDSAGRHRQSRSIAAYELEQGGFAWLTPPIINRYTRLCVITDAMSQRLMVQGYEGPVPVTPLFNLVSVAHETQQAS